MDDAKRRRPQPILDLNATELAAEAAAQSKAGEGGAAGTAAAATTPGGPEAAGSSGEPSAFAQGAVLPHETAQHPAAKAPRAAGTIRSPVRTVALATAGAVIGAAAVLAVAWVAGVTRTDERTAARIAKLEGELRELAARPVATPAAVQSAADRAAAGEQALQALKGLQERIGQIDAALKAPPSAPAADPAIGDRVGKLDQATQTLNSEIAAVRRRLDEIAVAARAARETAARSEGTSSAAVASTADEIGGLNNRVATLEAAAKSLQEKVGTAASAPNRDRVARFATAAFALRIVVERGEPYAAELAAVKPLVDAPDRLKPLEAPAAKGLASARELAHELSRLLVGMRQAAEAREDAGLIERLQSSASRLVRIRPTGEDAPTVSSGDPLTVLETAAARTDIATALAAAEKLPAEMRAPLDAWIGKARTRSEALDAVRALAQEALAALGTTSAATARP